MPNLSENLENKENSSQNSNHLEHLQILENDFETESFGRQEMPTLDSNQMENIEKNKLTKEILETGSLEIKERKERQTS